MTTPERAAAAGILRLTSAGARVILALFLAVDLVLAIATLDNVLSPWPALVALVLVAASALLVTWPRDGVLPRSRAIGVVALTTAAAIVSTPNLPVAPVAGYATWHLGAITLVLLFVGMWGRFALAWTGFGLLVVVTAVWTFTLGGGNPYVLALLPNQSGTLVVGTLFAIGLRRTSRRIAELHARQAAIAAADAATRAAATERAEQAELLNATARPALERIAAAERYTDAEREAWVRLEASIRDRLRASALVSSELTAATDAARSRGVDVTLLDDSAGAAIPGAERSRLERALVRELDALRSGRLIARVLPPGRDHVATIVVDEEGGDSRRIDV
ncbi:hypothetical protein QT381_05435 [Galbitalea sp. SE-J8]|uniref:hypothetical protein n=1 Tax=Galbitalea sp. SE-J8 TaxID=3054952 RepID=UPI00259C7FBF|nr:hypothetical protein [Galbitalea sp. SE-J8]MDM4762445.1 hypothetical protein [Galbitalea sp. SE-J8]